MTSTRNQQSTSLKKGFLFSVTVPYTTISKQEAFDNLEYLCSKIVVCEEKHYNQENHHHLFLHLKKKALAKKVQFFVCMAYDIERNCLMTKNRNSLTSRGQLYIDSVRNQKSYLTYITKYDVKPLYKGFIDTQHFSFGVRASEWAENVESFQENDGFVVGHATHYKYLERLHAASKKQHEEHVNLEPYNETDAQHIKGYPDIQNIPWAQTVKEWLNKWITNGRQGKKSQLYVYGDSGMGKTRYINHLINSCLKYQNNNPNSADYSEDKYEHQIYKPTKHDFKFAWDTFDKDVHKVIMIDEFDHAAFDIDILKNALSGESFKANVKGQPGKFIKPDVPFVIMSNHAPPDETVSSKFKGFIERIIVVNANQKLYHDQ